MVPTIETIRARSTAPLRGTQSFVAVMGMVWKRPGLLALELLWRWVVGIPLLWLASRALAGVHLDWTALHAMTVFKPTEAVETLRRQLDHSLPAVTPVLRWLLPVGLLAWTASATLGQTAIWRRLDPALQARLGTVGALKLLRSLALLTVFVAWIWGLARIVVHTITGPAASGLEPNLVASTAQVVVMTLALFMFWSLTVWLLDSAPLFAMATGDGFASSLRAALRSRPLRSKLIETNLVMGIVKVCLLVLAMVFSASPLPFETVESQGFLLVWWIIVVALYLAASDLFHVIRRAANLAMFRALVTSPPDTTPGPARAS